MPTIVKYILVFFISMVPIIELRGAVPIGVTAFGLNEYITLAVCVVGNMLPVPIIYLFARKVLIWGSKLKHGSGIFKWFLQKGEKAGQKLTAKSKKNGAFIALMRTCLGPLLQFHYYYVLMAGIIMLVISLLAKAGITSVSDLF